VNRLNKVPINELADELIYATDMPIRCRENAITFQSIKSPVSRRDEKFFLTRPLAAAPRRSLATAMHPNGVTSWELRATLVRHTPKSCIHPINAIRQSSECDHFFCFFLKQLLSCIGDS
jgi:hypothetical protein